LAQPSPRDTAIRAFDWVRDEIQYDPHSAATGREGHRATVILERGRGYCVQKAVLLAAVCRAAGIPARLGFADVRNHKSPPKLLEIMGTNLFVFHGYVELRIDGQWVKATPTFDRASAQKAGAFLVELDGSNDAMLHPVDPEGHPYIEYIRDRGHYADLPFEELQETLLATYAPMLRGQRPPS
jgi:transglutaminase-like putative cysteine protease